MSCAETEGARATWTSCRAYREPADACTTLLTPLLRQSSVAGAGGSDHLIGSGRLARLRGTARQVRDGSSRCSRKSFASRGWSRAASAPRSACANGLLVAGGGSREPIPPTTPWTRALGPNKARSTLPPSITTSRKTPSAGLGGRSQEIGLRKHGCPHVGPTRTQSRREC